MDGVYSDAASFFIGFAQESPEPTGSGLWLKKKIFYFSNIWCCFFKSQENDRGKIDYLTQCAEV